MSAKIVNIDLIVGLGNPGSKYEQTRHNAGFWFVDEIARQCGAQFRTETKFSGEVCKVVIENHDIWLLKPQTFMNLSGHAVRSLLSYYKIPPSDFILIYDDLDMDLGRIRLKKRGGAGGHNGVASVIQELGTDQFVRLKIGIEKDPRFNTADYVLSPFQREKQQVIEKSIARTVDLLPLLIEGRIDEAMNRFNAPLDPDTLL